MVHEDVTIDKDQGEVELILLEVIVDKAHHVQLQVDRMLEDTHQGKDVACRYLGKEKKNKQTNSGLKLTISTLKKHTL